MSGDNLAIVLFLVGTTITIALAAMNAAGWKHPILIRSLFAFAGVFVVIAAWFAITIMSPTIKLASIDPFEKGIRYEAAIFSRTLNTDGKTVILKWGNNRGNTDIITSDKYRARLAFTIPGKEQYFYFMLVAPYLPHGQRVVTILNKDDFAFRHEWENK